MSSSAHSRSAPLVAVSLPSAFLIAVRAAIVARNKGHDVEHYHQAKVAEDVLTAALPKFMQDIRTVGSRKGKSAALGTIIGSQLGGPTAAALVALWSVRDARLPGIKAMFRTSAGKAGFCGTLLKLLGQAELAALKHRVGWPRPLQP